VVKKRKAMVWRAVKGRTNDDDDDTTRAEGRTPGRKQASKPGGRRVRVIE
jgi:hypothetical protein